MGLHLDLSPGERAELAALLEAARSENAQATSLNELVTRWSALVAAVERGYEGSIYDYTNDLSVRDTLARLCAQMSPQLRSKLEAVLRSVDRRFVVATEDASEPLSLRRDDRALWWWRRVPKLHRGELALDLESLGQVRGAGR